MSDNGTGEARATAGLPEGLTSDVRALIEMMGRGAIAELHLETPAVKLHLRARDQAGGTPAGVAPAAHAALAEAAAPAEPAGIVITAPMIGTFYRTPAPGEPAFVEIGDTIEQGQTIGIIEAMKIMNEIPSEFAGVVAEFLVANTQAVEYGQPLLRLEPHHS